MLKPASWNVYKEIILTNPNFPIGGLICTKHKLLLEAIIKEKNKLAEKGTLSCDDMNDNNELYKPSLYLITQEERTASKKILDNIFEAVAPEISPIKYQVTTSVDQLSSHIIRKVKRKYNQIKENCKKRFCESLALL